MTAEHQGRRGNSGLSLVAPPPGLPFPTCANMTAAELLAFFPNSLKCADVVYRFVSNSGTRKTIYTMVNTFRDFEVEWSANSCGTLLYKTMEGAGYPGWTIKKHNDWHSERKADWNEDKLDVGGFQTPNKLAQSVSFKSLAVDVRQLPGGNDALDLTRMVQHCVANPAEVWTYPEDFEKLLNLLGGATAPREEHTDIAVFGRWEGRNPPLPTVRLARRETMREDPADKKKKKKTKNESRETATATQSMSESESRSSTPASVGQLKAQKRGQNMKQTRAGSRVELDNSDSEGWEYSKPYTRQLAEYVEPPGNYVEPSEQSVLLAFEVEGVARETDPYSAYAFGGPRDASPYRLLHCISQPHPYDTSGWAENLRWGFEQRALFAHNNGTKWWNESPEHMARIEHERVKYVWASDELQDALLD